jgi:hypothetical protein
MSSSENLVIRLIHALATSPEALEVEVREFASARPSLSQSELAEAWADRIVRLFTSEGVVTALPGAIPGLGTAAQVGVEATAATGELAYMLRCMGRLVGGVAGITGHDVSSAYTLDLVRVLGMWCGVMVPVKKAVTRVGTKVAVAAFNRHVSGALLRKINQKVGATILTKYGTKRGGIALGRLVPFGVGAIIGGSANYVTMSQFRASALRYYTDRPDLELA